MPDLSPKVPAHLRRFVVEQDYAEYDAVDQAVWRFVLLQTHARLVHTAHPAYREGLEATGLSVEHIPHIAEMNDRLGRFGWGAVCVDGFIPPRAFQEFQAAGILPIAADIRSHQHLVYTPAPDIIHEAAGHAPILPAPEYAAYLRRIGEVGRLCFTIPEEDRAYQAIYRLSEVKEDPSLGASAVAAVEGELEEALAAIPETSEAAWLSRLYWWTAEYGLVGSVDDYRLYGAGLLSSLGESHFCHDSKVKKIPLDAGCIEVGYDITRPQPQLFVARDFEALHEVLAEVEKTLAVSLGGATALERALRSRELCTVRLSSGGAVMGVLCDAEAAFLELEGPSAFTDGHRIRRLPGGPDREDGALALLGPLEDGTFLERLDDAGVARRSGCFAFASGAVVTGEVEQSLRIEDGRLLLLGLKNARIELPGREPIARPSFSLLAAGKVVTAHAGAQDPSYFPDAPAPRIKVPRPRHFPESELGHRRLFEDIERARGSPGLETVAERIHARLRTDYPEDWLLRWNILESLLKTGHQGPIAESLVTELAALEERFEHRQPIASGLRYLERWVA